MVHSNYTFFFFYFGVLKMISDNKKACQWSDDYKSTDVDCSKPAFNARLTWIQYLSG